jgi:MOSC domain-containing protein YiiM
MPHVASIVFKPRNVADPKPADHYARVAADSVRLVEGHGIENDRLGGRRHERQLNVMCRATLDQLAAEGYQTEPGRMGEQVVIDGLVIDELPAGTRLALGETVIEVAIPRTGCDRFEHIQGKHKSLARGRMGVLAKVVTGGVLRVGDEVRLVPA